MSVAAENDYPDAPWILHGDAIARLGVRGVTAFVHYVDSPVGPYQEMAVAQLTWRGPRVVAMPVTDERAMRAGREIWGFPKSLRALRWQSTLRRDGERISFDDGKQRHRFRIARSAVALSLRGWTIQTRCGQDVRVPVCLKARFHLAWHGPRLAIALRNFELIVAAAQEI